MTISKNDLPVTLSIGIMTWNEEVSIGPMLESLFRQSIFGRLEARNEGYQIVCLANGCTDRTVEVARAAMAKIGMEYLDRLGQSSWVEEIPEPGRNNAWNMFVHEFSAPEARYLCLMDADIVFDQANTLELVVGELERNPHLGGASDCPRKNIAGKARLSHRERLSLAASDMTETIEGRLNGMLYCLRAGIARNLYLPRDLIAIDDGFFKAAVCTDFFSAPVDPSKVVSVRGASHLYEPYLSFRDVMNNQKRQMIGQTTVYVAIEHVKTLPLSERANLNATFRAKEAHDPDWLKRLIEAHVARPRPFWRLFPGILGFRWKRLAKMRGRRRLTHFPAAAAGFFITLLACWQALRFLRRGVSTYWPKTVRQTIVPESPYAAKN